MSAKADVISRLADPGIIAVVRAPNTEVLEPLTRALVDGGVFAIEITLSTPNAFQAIRELSTNLANRALIGVGTVLTPHECGSALEAGAQFVVTPILRPELVRLAHDADRPIMLGAYTPTEAQLAHEAGADFIKLFPADTLGPAYLKSLLAPMPHLRFVPTGGIELSNAAEFLQAGAAALGVGSALAPRRLMETRDWAELQRIAEAFVEVTGRASCSRTKPG